MVISLSMWPPRRRPNTTGSRAAPKPFLVDSQWVLIKDLLRHPPKSKRGGRPQVAARAFLEGILWILRTGARWQNQKKQGSVVPSLAEFVLKNARFLV